VVFVNLILSADICPRAEQQHSDDGAATTQTFTSAYAPR
jgi:hypothetical protein